MDFEGPIAPCLKASYPHKEAVSPEGSLAVATQDEAEDVAIGDDGGRGVSIGVVLARRLW